MKYEVVNKWAIDQTKNLRAYGQLRKTALSLTPQENVQPVLKTICRECKRTLLYL